MTPPDTDSSTQATPRMFGALYNTLNVVGDRGSFAGGDGNNVGGVQWKRAGNTEAQRTAGFSMKAFSHIGRRTAFRFGIHRQALYYRARNELLGDNRSCTG